MKKDYTFIKSVETAADDIKNGKMVIIVDDEDRENEGDLVMAASMVAFYHKINFGHIISIPYFIIVLFFTFTFLSVQFFQ